jgi:hypothetical protein
VSFAVSATQARAFPYFRPPRLSATCFSHVGGAGFHINLQRSHSQSQSHPSPLDRVYFYCAFAELDDIASSPRRVAEVVLAGIPFSVKLQSQRLSAEPACSTVQTNDIRSNINEQLFTGLNGCCMCVGATEGATRRARLSSQLGHL